MQIQELKEGNHEVSERLKEYFSNKFTEKEKNLPVNEGDTEYMKFWKEYFNNNSTESIPFKEIYPFYPQLLFPVEEGIEKQQRYRDAVLKGLFDTGDSALPLHDENGIVVSIFKSIAGEIPVIKVSDADDFETVIQALIYKNSPKKIPASMGASLISGINNWKRIHTMKENWLHDHPLQTWNDHFSKNIVPNSYLFKDTLIVLSSKPYSNVEASHLKINDQWWKEISLKIRLEHECVHLYTQKKYGIASNNLHDELIADYIGIVKAAGEYKKEWMLAFMGLENYPEYRKGARLENYLSGFNLSEQEFAHLTTIIKNAIDHISVFDSELGPIETENDHKKRIECLCEVDLLDIAGHHGPMLLLEKYSAIR